MSISIQNFRSKVAGESPDFLCPGQLAFNLADQLMFLGDGTDYRKDVNGTTILPNPPEGKGWQAYQLTPSGGGAVSSVSGSGAVVVSPTVGNVEVSLQITDSTTTTSSDTALSATGAKSLQDQITALSVSSNLTFAGTVSGATGFMQTVTTEGTAAGFAVGSAMPAAASGNAEFFAIVTVAGTMTPPGGTATSVHPGDWWLSSGTAYQLIDSGQPGDIVPPATPTVAGILLGCTVSNNTSLGCNALLGNTSTGNTAVGVNALNASPSGDNNTALGACALTANTGGVNNTAVGSLALSSTTTGGFNTGIGRDALLSNTIGVCNTVVGYRGGSALTSGNFNTLLGTSAGCSLTTTNSNVAIGAFAGSAATGGCNIFIGVQSGCVANSGVCNVVIGTYVNAPSATGSCQLAIGYDANQYWLTGTCTKAIKPGAGIIDCADSCGTAGQVLMSNGSNAICWGTSPSAAISSISARGTVFAATSDNLVTNTAFGWESGKYATGWGGLFFGTYVSGVCVGAGCGVIAIGGDTLLRYPGQNNQLVIQDSRGECFYYLRAWCAASKTYFQPGGGIVDSCNCAPAANCILIGNASNGQVWSTPPYVGCSLYSTKGTIAAASAVDTPTALPVGSDGTVLTACSACTTGLAWATPAGGDGWTSTTSAAVSMTTGVPIRIFTWSANANAWEGELSMIPNTTVPQVYKFAFSGDDSQYFSTWDQSVYWQYPEMGSGNELGSWTITSPVYPDPDAAKFIATLTPARTETKPFTLRYRVVSAITGLDFAWAV